MPSLSVHEDGWRQHLCAAGGLRGMPQPGQEDQDGVQRGVHLGGALPHALRCALQLAQQVAVEQRESVEELHSCDCPLGHLTLQHVLAGAKVTMSQPAGVQHMVLAWLGRLSVNTSWQCSLDTSNVFLQHE